MASTMSTTGSALPWSTPLPGPTSDDVLRLPTLLPTLERYLKREVIRFQRAVDKNRQPFMEQRSLRLQALCSALSSMASRALEAGPGAWMAGAPEAVVASSLVDPLAVAEYVGEVCGMLARVSDRRGRQVDVLCSHQMQHLTWSRH